MTGQLPIIVILGPLLAAILAAFAGWFRPKLSHPLVVLGLAISFAAALKLVFIVADTGAQKYWLGGWGTKQSYGVVGIQITVDTLNTLLLVAVSGIALLTALYAKRLVDTELAGRQRYFYALFSLLVAGLLGITITGDIFNLYVFMEIAALSSYALIAYGKGRAYMASFNYLIMGTVGACLYLLGVGFVFIKRGTLNIDNLSGIIPTLDPSQALFVGFVLILLGVWVKMAFFPFHGWLPNAYTHAPTASAAVLAPLATKVAVYAMLRIMFTVYSLDYIIGSPGIQSLALYLSTFAIVVASFFSLTQTNLKKLASYFVLSEIGYMVGGAWLANKPGVTGAMYHVVDVERAGLGKNKPDPQQVQTGTHGAHDEIVEGSHIGATPSVGYERVAGQRGNLHEHVEVENVAGDRDAKQASDQQREKRVKVPLPPGEFGVNQAPGVNGSQQSNAGHGSQEQGVEVVDRDLYADDKLVPLVSPAAEPIFLSAGIGNNKNQLQCRSE